MTLYAFDDIDDAIDATRAFLWPFDLRRWAKLALVVFFIGGFGSGFNPAQWTGNTPPGGGGDEFPADPGAIPDVDPEVLAIVLALVGVALLIGLVFAVVGSIMEFVFVESLRRETVSIRRYWGERWGQGLRLFGFRFVLGLLMLAIVAVLAVVALSPIIFGGGDLSIGLVLLAVFAFFVIAIVVGLIQGFTTEFVVPVMMAEECGVLSGWSRFWPTLSAQWKQYLVYAVMAFVLRLAAGLVVGIAGLVVAILLLIPFGAVGLLGGALLAYSQLAGWIVIGIVGLAYFLTLVVIFLFVSVPVQSFLRYYALLVLGDTNEAFDLIPERRRSIRAGEESDESPGAV